MANCIDRLRKLSEEKYRDFCAPLIPNIEKERILGVRLPKIRDLAKSLAEEEREEIFSSLPHYYLEEYHLHSFLICGMKDYDRTVEVLEKLLPYVDNWSVCDSIRPISFKKNRERLLADIDRWLKRGHIYTKRFAVEMLMVHFLDEDFSPEILERASKVKSEDYYLDMMIAWFFATALAKRWEYALPYIEEGRLPERTHNMIISKAIDSYRISDERKKHLRTLKLKG